MSNKHAVVIEVRGGVAEIWTDGDKHVDVTLWDWDNFSELESGEQEQFKSEVTHPFARKVLRLDQRGN